MKWTYNSFYFDIPWLIKWTNFDNFLVLLYSAWPKWQIKTMWKMFSSTVSTFRDDITLDIIKASWIAAPQSYKYCNNLKYASQKKRKNVDLLGILVKLTSVSIILDAKFLFIFVKNLLQELAVDVFLQEVIGHLTRCANFLHLIKWFIIFHVPFIFAL